MKTNAKVVFHLSGRVIENYASRPHLKLFSHIKDLFNARGGTIEVRRRDPYETDWSDLLEAENLHIIENGSAQQSNVLNTTLAYLHPYYHLDPKGVLANSSIGAQTFDPKTVDKDQASAFWAELQARFVIPRHSRYGQLREKTEIPEGSIAVFLQGDVPHKQQTAYCDTETLIRTVVAGAQGRPVVIKAHPSSDTKKDAALVLGLMTEGLDLFPTDANVHDILGRCAVSVSYNSAVAIEGFLHRKPAILFGKSDFHHMCETVTTPGLFPDALAKVLARAKAREQDYPAFLTWYFSNFCYDTKDPHLDDKILTRFAQSGFSEERLGLAPVRPFMFLDKLAAQADAKRTLQAFLTERPEITSFTVNEMLKISDQSWVFKGKVNGKKVVIKRFLTTNAADTVKSLKRELDYIETVFDDSRFQANRCLLSWPEHGVVVLSFAPGKRLGKKIAESSGNARNQLMQQSGEWLRRYCAPRQRSATFAPRFRITQLAAKDISHVFDAADQALLADVLEALKDQVRNVRGVSVVHAATHGNFVGINTHFHKGAIYGVDIQGECWLAVTKEAARFLVWLQIHDANRPPDRRYGIATPDLTAFLSSEVLSKNEESTTLPFFIGEQLYGRFIEFYPSKGIRENTRAAIQGYLKRL